jgi:membrane-bound lytic murein transglycosylase D
VHSKNILPLVLLLTSACAQVPFQRTLGENQPAAQSEAPAFAPPPPTAVRPSLTVTTAPLAISTVGADVPSPTPAPKLQTAQNIAASVPDVRPTEELPSRSLWPRITKGFAMAPVDNDLVREWENWYANRPEYVARMIDRSRHFLFHIVQEVEKRQMPMEVALLPMIESAYNPVAYSRAHASGIWQFIPSTGKDYGLRQNWWYDGRRDVIAATGAALDYLERLHGMFGDWQLALASYNWGEGAVGRAMERNRAKGLSTDYESLTVPSETRSYIPKLMAVKNIIANPARYGLQIADIPNESYFETVLVKRHIDLKVAAKLAEMPMEEFKFLNPGHNKPVIKAGEGELLVLPKHKTATFLANLQKHDQPLVSWQAIRLRPGEKVERVAEQHGMTLAELKQVNGLQNQRRFTVGQPLLVALKGGTNDPQLLDLPAMPVSLPKAIQAAKNAIRTRKQAQVIRTKQAIPYKAAQAKGGKHAARHVKSAAAKPPSTKKAQPSRVKVATR